MHMPSMRELRGELTELVRKRERQAFNPLTVAICSFFPPILFGHIFRVLAFGLRFRRPLFAWLVGPGLGVLLLCLPATRLATHRRHGRLQRGWVTLATLSGIALVSSILAADSSYRWFTSSYYTYQDAASYTNVDPSKDKGQTYMDAGQIYFKESTQVLTQKATAFQSGAVYCVAPIVSQPISSQDEPNSQQPGNSLTLPDSGTVDFWAVGQDCCEPSGQQFKCGQVDNPRARAGIRALRDDLRPFYTMAVQEWSAQMGLPTKHPLFFHWVEDPLLQVDEYMRNADKMYVRNVVTYIFINFFMALLLLWALLQVGLQ